MGKNDASYLKSLFEERLDSLSILCQQFDKGRRHFFVEISSVLRVLFHHNPSSNCHSLISQLGLQSAEVLETQATMTSGVEENIIYPASGLIYQVIQRDGDKLAAGWEPHLSVVDGSGFPPIFFPTDQWWRDCKINMCAGVSFTRSELIRDVANNDGGAHVSRKIKEKYYKLSRGNFDEWRSQLIKGDAVSFPNDPIDPSRIVDISNKGAGLKILQAIVRQIANEVLYSFSERKSDYVAALQKPEFSPGYSFFIELSPKRA